MPTVTLNPVADNYVWSIPAYAGTNYGTSDRLYFGDNYNATNGHYFFRSFVRFDLSTIPAGASVSSSTFHFNKVFGSTVASTATAHRVTASWTETGQTWNNQPGVTTAGAAAITVSSDGWYSWNITTMTQAWVSGTANYGLRVIGDESSAAFNEYGGYSRDHATASYRPYLTVTYNNPPATPTNLSPTGGAQIDAKVNNTFTWSYSDPDGDAKNAHEIYYRVAGTSAWTSTGVIASSVASHTFAANTFGGNLYEWQVRHRDAANLWSGWSAISTFEALANEPPLAPTLVAPINNEIIDRSATQRLDWEFNDPDAGDTQSAYDGRYRIAGTTTWTGTFSGTSPNSHHDLPGGTLAAGDYEWQVRTADAEGVYGPYSASGFFTAADAPAPPTITSPANNGNVTTDPTSVAWSTPSQASYQVRTVADSAGSPDATTVYYDSAEQISSTLRAHVTPFATNNRYEHIQVRVKVGGLWSSWSSIRVLVSYEPPQAPLLTLTRFDADGYIHAAIDNPAWKVVVSDVTYAGTGNGTMTGPTATDGVTDTHNWTATLVTAAAGGGTFDVAVDGTVVGQATVGTQFTYEGLSFTINAGTTDYAVGDRYSWSTTAIKVTSNDLYRKRATDATWTRIAADIAPDGEYRDYAVASGIEYVYYVRAHGDNEVPSDSLVYAPDAPLTLRFAWVHDPTDPVGTVYRFRFNNEGGEDEYEPELELNNFAGRSLPVAEFGEGEPRRVSVNVDLADPGDLEAARRFAEARRTLLYRDSSGRKTFGVIPRQSIESAFYGGRTTLEIVAVSHTEAV